MALPSGAAFGLHPFDPGVVPPALRLSGRVERQDGRLSLIYHLEGPLQTLRLPPWAQAPGRRDELWTTTCFECFLATGEQGPYWEVNLSPAGHWNLYRLEDYRSGLRPESACGTPSLQLDSGECRLTLRAAIPLPPALAAATRLHLGVTAVIASAAGELSYWALAHPGPEPDFHRRDGFLLRL
ncbi:DOMON-like domain-containing protein [Synechococcus sp. CCY 9618]|uniref:DOMON-like domain-containing protein n=1 Tax=Synechococcus sp. CCY 9618 TaxID=2815602 RepID=UPI001C21A86D|nr:DOMON-like domain-containing protein [Synechococcus sp. CCY 9618]